MRGTKRTSIAALATVGLATAALAGCSPAGGSGGGDSEGPVTIRMTTHTNIGYEPLIAQFEEENPDIKVELTITGMSDLSTALVTQLAAGNGAPDVVGVGNSFVPTLSTYADKFLDLKEYDGKDVSGDWLPWVSAGATTAEGQLLGYGTDTGGLAMCYNKAVFEAAGLPTDREEVSALWPTWDDYIATGLKFQAAGTDASWTDSAQNIYQTAQGQQEEPLFNRDDEFTGESDPENRAVYDIATTLATEDLTAKVPPFSDELKAALAGDKVATSFCPPWYSGLLQNWVGEDGAGKWDIASIPEDKGNWGGTYLLVPSQTKYPEQARTVAHWFTAAPQQVSIFTAQNTFPSAVAAIDDEAVAGATSEYFSGAPIGQIYGGALKNTTGQFFAPSFENVAGTFIAAVVRVEQGLQNPDEAWDQALEEAEAALTNG